VICALGNDRQTFWSALTEGRNGFGPLQCIDGSELRCQTFAEVKNFTPDEFFDPKNIRFIDRFAQFAIIAAREAVGDAELSWTAERKKRFGVILGSSTGGQTTEDAGFVDLYRKNRPRVDPTTIPRVMANSGVSQISIEFGLTGPAFTTSTACSSSNHAIGQAFSLVRSGLIDGAITGGSDAPFSFGNLKAWEALRVLSSDICRPFSKNRQGITLGEGAGALLIESLEHARARGARIYAEIVGFGMSADAFHIIQPTVEGPAAAMQAAMDDAGIRPEDVDYINAHGTGTTANDVTETASIRRVFGEQANALSISSTKSMHGHALGAAGALEGVATVLTIEKGVAPPTANFLEADPECDLDVIPNSAREAKINCALSNSFAFGGLNAVLAFRRWSE
jgi:nodulation protein E